ncbi:MAG TPA: response regulator, partial [Roseimicrobium sp.]|nr:response regulator [Roseimicrobium sp.]
RKIFEHFGYKPDFVTNGVEVLGALRQKKFDVICMDVQMPEMNGLEASRQLREMLPPARQPWIIGLTANAMPGDRELCLAAGMDDYLTKPVRVQDIERSLRAAIGVRAAKMPSA